MDGVHSASSKGGCFTPVGGQGFQMLKAFHDPPIKFIFFQHVTILLCGFLNSVWSVEIVFATERGIRKSSSIKKCSGSYLRTLLLNFETRGCLCSRIPEYSLSAVFSHTEDGTGAAMGAPIVLGPWGWKSFLDKWTKDYFAWLQSLECSWRPRFQMILPRKKRARPETERELKGNNEIDLKRKDKIAKKHASIQEKDKESKMQWTAIGIQNQLCTYCKFKRCWEPELL